MARTATRGALSAPHPTTARGTAAARNTGTERARSTRWNRSLSSAVVGLAVFSGGLQAQAPGYQQLNPGAVRAEYLAEVLDRLNELLAVWGASWAEDRIDDLVALYAEDAVLIPPDAVPMRGRTQIRDYFAAALPNHGHVEAFMLDFDASGEMSQVYANYTLGIQQGEEAGAQKRGPMVTVYVRRGRRWLIRTQVFLPS